MTAKVSNIPVNVERQIQKRFWDLYQTEIIFFDRLVGIYNTYLLSLNNKFGPEVKLEYTEELLLGYALGLCLSSFSSLSQGYLNSSQIILRAAIENLTWAMYLFEFPENIDFAKDFRDLSKEINKLKNPSTKIQYKRWIEGALDRIDVEGSKLFVSDNWEWKRRVFDSICEEANHFVHTDLKFIDSLITVNEKGTLFKIAGPIELKNTMLIKNGLWKIVEVMLLSVVVFSKVFAEITITIDSTLIRKDRKIIQNLVEALNKFKKEYNETTYRRLPSRATSCQLAHSNGLGVEKLF